ncbi:MAG: hypothetical protein ACUVRH_02445 [Candidatus Bipolaricaulia bacterium]
MFAAAEGKRPRFCVLGAGHGGLAMAGHLALMGFEVNLYNRTEERIWAIQQRGGIELGLLDAPHFRGHRYARGAVVTEIIDGACYAIDPSSGRPLTEAERLGRIRLGRKEGEGGDLNGRAR